MRPLVRIPNLAIHLNRGVNNDGLVLNMQQHLAPVLGLETSTQESLLELLVAELKRSGRQVEPKQILCWDLCLYDSQRAALSGIESEFIQSGRLDNLAGCFAALTALETARADHDATRVIVLYDHEEVGSRSAQGAYSSLLRFALQRITEAFQQGQRHEAFARAMARSFLISADMAHAIHPNYPEKHESNHAPILGRGPVLKMNVNQSYATDGMTAARLEQWCRKAEVKLQPFVTRSDMPCGSTVGPITAAELGLATVDVGNPLLSMHSVREMCACSDVNAFARLLDCYFG